MKDQLESLISQLIEQGIRYAEAVSEFEKRFIKTWLDKTKGNQSKAAKVLGIHRNTLSRKIQGLGLHHRSRPRGRMTRRTAAIVGVAKPENRLTRRWKLEQLT